MTMRDRWRARRITAVRSRQLKQQMLAWAAKQDAANPNRYYGDGGTVHDSTTLSVEVHQGQVVAVWFRCQMLPFDQYDVGTWRANEMAPITNADLPTLHGVELSRRGL